MYAKEYALINIAKKYGFTVTIIDRYNHKCFCNFPIWLIKLTKTHYWSDNTVTFTTIKLNLHNFIECDDVIEIHGDLNLRLFRTLNDMQTDLIHVFNNLTPDTQPSPTLALPAAAA